MSKPIGTVLFNLGKGYRKLGLILKVKPPRVTRYRPYTNSDITLKELGPLEMTIAMPPYRIYFIMCDRLMSEEHLWRVVVDGGKLSGRGFIRSFECNPDTFAVDIQLIFSKPDKIRQRWNPKPEKKRIGFVI